MQKILKTIILMSVCGFTSLACSSKAVKEPARVDEMNEEVQLKEDRKHLEELRKDIPEEVQVQNDEKAFTLKFFTDGSRPPPEVMNKFNEAVRRRRDKFSAEERKSREGFTSDEKKKREEFLAGMKTEREKFYGKKPDQKERQNFSTAHDIKRREWFDDERDRRKEFEATLRQKRSDFDLYMKERRSDFDNEYKVYSKEWNDRQKMKREQAILKSRPVPPPGGTKVNSAQDPDLKEFESIPKTKGTTLQPADGE